MSPRLSLEIIGASDAPTELPQKGKLVIGADASKAGLVVAGQGVAGVHCAIGRVKGGGWALKDMGSEYGTLVNGQRVSAARLAVGDMVVLGSKRIRVFDPGRPQAQAAPTPSSESTSPARPAPEPAPTAEPAPAAAQQPAAQAPPQVPDTARRQAARKPRIPGYTIERELGRGSSGVVWLAIQESLNRKVALKVLAPKLAADATFVSRFQAEARAAAALNHPNVVHVYDFGEDGGHHFLSMEFMSTGCLESRLGALGPVPWREVLDILTDATKGLVYAESRRIVHRDIKPANLMQNEEGTTKIADLGLAIEVEQKSLEQTSERKVLGTPHFIAPELIRGGTPDARSDLYSLGATAYRLLSGHTPFEGERSTEILRASLTEEPRPLAERVLGLPPGVAFLVHRLLAKDPDARHPSAAVLLAELERLRAGDLGTQKVAGARSASKPPVALIGAGVGVALLLIAWALFGRDGSGTETDPTPGGGGHVDGAAGPGDGTGGSAGAGGGEAPLIPEIDNGGGPVTPVDDDLAEQAFEDEAELALRRLGDTEHTEEERIAALRELATRFPGTTAATTATTEADRLLQTRREADAARTALEAARESLLGLLRAAAELEVDPPHAGRALRAISAVPGQENFAADATFLAQRQALVDAVLRRALEYAQDTWSRAGQLETEGDFAAVDELLTTFIGTVDFPEFAGAPPAQVTTIREIAGRARDKKDNLDALRATFAEQQRSIDRVRVVAGLGGPSGLEAELRALDLEAASARLTKLVKDLRTEAARARVAPLLQDLILASGALEHLTAGWTAGSWKRRTVLDPRMRKPGPIEVVGADAQGLMLSGSSTPERVPWGAFAGRTIALNHLFHERLNEDWTDEQFSGIAVLLRVSAILEAIDAATPVLAGETDARFGSDEEEALLAGFEFAALWAERADRQEAAQREQTAATDLARALRAADDGRWAETEALLARLLDEGDRSLLVSLLSDGGDL